MSIDERRLGAWCGIAGPLCLIVYFGAPALLGWPFAGAPADQLASYAIANEFLFYAGAWFQATGTLLSVVFFLTLVHLSGATQRLAGSITVVMSATLLALVLVEAALMMAVPGSAKAGDAATLVTAFALSNGAFVRVFALAPASVTYIALGSVLLGATVLPRAFGFVAVGLGLAFELAGIIALFAQVGVILAIVLSVAQALWIIVAATALLRAK